MRSDAGYYGIRNDTGDPDKEVAEQHTLQDCAYFQLLVVDHKHRADVLIGIQPCAAASRKGLSVRQLGCTWHRVRPNHSLWFRSLILVARLQTDVLSLGRM